MTDVAAPALPRIEHLWGEPAFGSALAGRLADAYGAPLSFARRSDRPTIVANFVSTLDGVVSYAPPEALRVPFSKVNHSPVGSAEIGSTTPSSAHRSLK